MRSRLVFWMLVVVPPVGVYFLLTIGRQYDDFLGGRLLQVLGGFIGLGWTTLAFLALAQGMTRLFRSSRSSDEQEQVQDLVSTEPGRPPRRRAA